MVKTYASTIIQYRYLILFATLLFVVLSGVGLKNIRFTTDYRVFFSEDNPQLRAFDEIQNTYTKNDNILFVISPKDGVVFQPSIMQLVRDMTKDAWQIAHSSRVDSVTNFQYTHAEEDDLIVEDLVKQPQSLTPTQYEKIKAIAIKEPLLINRLISEKADVTGVNVTILLPGKDIQKEVPESVAQARALAQKYRDAYPGVDIRLTGITMMNNAFSEASQNDIKSLIPIMFLVVIVTLGFLLRNVSGTIATLFIIFFSIIATIGLVGWANIPMTPPTASAPTIILTLAVADSVHILMNMLHAMRRGMSKHDAIIESLRINMQPVFLTSFTTAIGFLSMNFSDAPPFRDLGNIVAVGVMLAFIFSVTFLPALVSLLPIKVKTLREAPSHPMDAVADFVVRRRNVLFWGMLSVIILLVVFIPKNELNDEFVKYFDSTVSFRADTDYSNEHLTGIYIIQYSLSAGETGGVSNPAFLQKVDEFVEWYRKQPEVTHVNTVTDIMRRLNKNMHADDPSWYRLPDERELSAQYLLLYELSLPYGLDLNNQIDVDKSSTLVTVTVVNTSSNQLLDIEKRAQVWLKDNAPQTMQVAGASPSVMFANIGKRNIQSMLIGTSLALIVISMILIIALRSVKIGLISLIPNLVPAAMAFGLWGLLVGEVGLALSVVTGMTIGIVVDDTVHFLSKYLRARRERNMSSEDAVRYAFSTVGTALWVTSLVLIAGFFVLTFSTFKLNAGMGLLTAIAIGFALLADFLFLPPLLMKLEKKHEKDTARRAPSEPVTSTS